MCFSLSLPKLVFKAFIFKQPKNHLRFTSIALLIVLHLKSLHISSRSIIIWTVVGTPTKTIFKLLLLGQAFLFKFDELKLLF